MKQVSNELATAVVASLLLRIDDLCPDIGWGMMKESAVDNALAALGLSRNDVNVNEVLKEVTR